MFGDGDQAQGAGTSSEQGAGAGTTTATATQEVVEVKKTTETTPAIPQEAPADDALWETMPKWIRDLRRENASHRTKARDVETKLQTVQQELDQYKQKDMTELEKANAEKQRLEEQLARTQKEQRDLQVKFSATQLGIVDPDAASKLIDWEAVDKGKSVEDALKELVEAKPWLKKVETSSSDTEESKTPAKPKDSTTSSTTPKTSGEGSTKIFKASEIRKLATEDPDAFNKLYEEGGLAEAMREGRFVNDIK